MDDPTIVARRIVGGLLARVSFAEPIGQGGGIGGCRIRKGERKEYAMVDLRYRRRSACRRFETVSLAMSVTEAEGRGTTPNVA